MENDQLTATNQIVVSKLRVAKAKQADDQVKSRLGLPLGLIVALIKDSNGNIVLNVPISGSLKDPNFDLSEAIWSSIKNVLRQVEIRVLERARDGDVEDDVAVGILDEGDGETEREAEPRLDLVVCLLALATLSF